MEAGLSPRQYLKKQRATTEQEAEVALETTILKNMLTDQGHILSNLNAYVCKLLEETVPEKDPREVMKILLKEGWMTGQGMVGTMTNELTLLWKAVRDFNTSQCNNQELEIADRSITTAKELGDNKYALAHNLMVRMTINAMGKAVKKNDKWVTSVALLLFSLWVIRSSSDP